MLIQIDGDIITRLNRVGRRIGVENNPIEIVVRALTLLDIVTERLQDGPVVIAQDDELFRPIVEEP